MYKDDSISYKTYTGVYVLHLNFAGDNSFTVLQALVRSVGTLALSRSAASQTEGDVKIAIKP